MKFHILGLMPDLFDGYFSQSLLGKARDAGLIEIAYHPLRDWSDNAYKSVDDKPYGGGAGMVLCPDIVCRAVRELRGAHPINKVILTSPRGKLYSAAKARELMAEKSILLVCGRYEGVDQRAIDAVIDEEISIGDYVVSGGEVAALVMIDAIARLVPGVVGNPDSVVQDSFEEGLLEHPHFTRPEIFENVAVPPVLTRGNHAAIAAWRRQESIRTTWKRRPDLIKQAVLTDDEKEFIVKMIR